MKTWLKFFFAVGLSSLMVVIIAKGDFADYIYPNSVVFFIVLVLLAFFFEWITKKW
jgi:hypothetical protein